MERVKKWTTMVRHFYNSTYCHAITIAVSDMQLIDVAA